MTDELLIKFLLKETSAEESTAIEKWLSADPANISRFLELEKIWESSQLLAPKSPVNADHAWLSFQERLSKRKEKETMVPIKRMMPFSGRYAWVNVAAIFILVFGAWFFYEILTPENYLNLAANQEVVIQKLPDGSELTLNKKTALSYASDFKKERSVRLDSGEVFFKVAPDKSHPFIIDVDDVTVQVVGTSFNVKHLKQQTEVIVETGIVKVSLKGETINLIAGERVLISSSSKNLIKVQNQDQLYNYYRTNVLVLRNTALWKLTEVLNEAYDVTIKADPALGNLTVYTTLKLDAPLDYNLGIICQILNLKYSSNGKEILLSNKK